MTQGELNPDLSFDIFSPLVTRVLLLGSETPQSLSAMGAEGVSIQARKRLDPLLKAGFLTMQRGTFGRQYALTPDGVQLASLVRRIVEAQS